MDSARTMPASDQEARSGETLEPLKVVPGDVVLCFAAD